MKIDLAEKNFEVGASQERVWRLIGKVIFSSLPGMENMEIFDENNFRAVLRMKTLGVPVSVKLKGEMIDVTPPESFSVRLFIQGLGGFLEADQKVSFTMKPVEKKKTAVNCKASVQDLAFLQRLFLLGQARSFANSTFDAIEKRLKELA